MSSTTIMLKYVSILLVGFAIGVFIYFVFGDHESKPRKEWLRYERWIDEQLRIAFIPGRGESIARAQLLLCALALAVSIHFEEIVLGAVAVGIVAFAPRFWIQKKSDERLVRLEAKLDNWLLMLSNALKATPSIGEALRSTSQLMTAPWSEELDIMVKEIDLGTPIDETLQGAANRLKSRSVAAALSTVIIARQTGGDLSKVLEESAATLRERFRLEGVLRAKTAEGRGQAFVLAAVPFFLMGMIHLLDPAWLAPLTASATGYAIVGVAAGMWIAAVIIARQILAVDF